MPANPVPVSRLIELPIALSWEEALALVQSMAAAGIPCVHGDPVSGTFEEFLIHEDGAVTAAEGRCPTLSVSEVALLLGRLLPGPGADPANRPPAGIHYLIGRALGLVEAPAFDTVSELHDGLARFEQQVRRSVLRFLFHRIEDLMSADRDSVREQQATCATPEAIEIEGADAVSAEERVVRRSDATNWFITTPARRGTPTVDRRRPSLRTDELRRLLREEDRQNYLARQSAPVPPVESEVRWPRASRTRAGTPPTDLLRRFIREADQRIYEMGRGADGGRQRRSLWPRHWQSVLLIAGLAALGGGIAELAHDYYAQPVPVPTRHVAAPPPVMSTARMQPTATASGVAAPGAPALQRPTAPRAPSAVRDNSAPHRMTALPPRTPSEQHSAASNTERPGRPGATRNFDHLTKPAPVAAIAPPSSDTPGAKASEDSPPATRVARRPAVRNASNSEYPGAVPRLFGYMYRRLGSIFHRQPTPAAGEGKPAEPDTTPSSKPKPDRDPYRNEVTTAGARAR